MPRNHRGAKLRLSQVGSFWLAGSTFSSDGKLRGSKVNNTLSLNQNHLVAMLTMSCCEDAAESSSAFLHPTFEIKMAACTTVHRENSAPTSSF